MSLKSSYRYVRHTPKGLLVVAIFLIGLIMRGPAAAVAPLALDLEKHFNIDLPTVGLLSGIPVFCFALFSPFASFLISKKGLEFTFITSVSLMTLGIIIRGFDSFISMVVATVIYGAAVALGNISIPLIAARDFPEKFALVTGLASATMNLGCVAAYCLTVPISLFAGIQLTLLSWSLLCLFVLWVWIAYVLRSKRGGSRKSLKSAVKIAGGETILMPDLHRSDASEKKPTRSVWKLPFTYGICWVFVCQCFGFFSLSAWLPTIFVDRGLDPSTAGLATGIFQFFGILGSISVYSMVKKFDFLVSYLIIAFCWVSLPFGLIFVPSLFVVWLTLAGFAQGANYIIMFTKITSFSKSDKERRTLSSATQISAYFVAGVSPTLIGAFNVAVGNWQTPLILILCVMVSMLVVGFFVYRK